MNANLSWAPQGTHPRCPDPCGKRRHDSEQATLLHIELHRDMFGPNGRAYKCASRGDWWHVATRGFSERSLRSLNRRVAWWVQHRHRVTVAFLVQKMGLSDYDRLHGTNRYRKLRKTLARMERIGLVEFVGDHRQEVAAAHMAGLSRVCEVGLTYYEQERRR